jgi:hypothetical protein
MTALEMRPEIRARWVAALRSGDYEQGAGYLRTDSQWCCLGVLCDLAERDGVVSLFAPAGSFVAQYGGCSAELPRPVMEWAALDDTDPYVMTSGGGYSLTHLNDDEKWDFAQIADAIEGAA